MRESGWRLKVCVEASSLLRSARADPTGTIISDRCPRLHVLEPDSMALRPAAGFFERLSGFQEALEAGQKVRPPVRAGLDELRTRRVALMDHRQLDRLADLFQLIRQA